MRETETTISDFVINTMEEAEKRGLTVQEFCESLELAKRISSYSTVNSNSIAAFRDSLQAIEDEKGLFD